MIRSKTFYRPRCRKLESEKWAVYIAIWSCKIVIVDLSIFSIWSQFYVQWNSTSHHWTSYLKKFSNLSGLAGQISSTQCLAQVGTCLEFSWVIRKYFLEWLVKPCINWNWCFLFLVSQLRIASFVHCSEITHCLNDLLFLHLQKYQNIFQS